MTVEGTNGGELDRAVRPATVQLRRMHDRLRRLAALSFGAAVAVVLGVAGRGLFDGGIATAAGLVLLAVVAAPAGALLLYGAQLGGIADDLDHAVRTMADLGRRDERAQRLGALAEPAEALRSAETWPDRLRSTIRLTRSVRGAVGVLTSAGGRARRLALTLTSLGWLVLGAGVVGTVAVVGLAGLVLLIRVLQLVA